DGPSGDLAAARAFLERHGFDALEGGARPIEEAEEEVVFGAGGRLLHPAQDLFVGDRRGARRERAFLDDVVDAAKERIGRRLALRQPIERLHATHQLGMRDGGLCVPSDRKSTRLNSSHDQISYAVFCLKKKNKKKSEHTSILT